MWSYYVPTLLHMDEIFVDVDGDGYVGCRVLIGIYAFQYRA